MEKNRMKVLVFEPGQEPHVEIINKNESAYRELVGGPITAKLLDDNTVIVYNDIKSEENARPNRWVGGAIISGTFFLASSDDGEKLSDNLLASGVLMEGYSVEDDGAGICYNVYCYNVQPGIKINYATGDSEAEDGSAPYGSSAVLNKPTQLNDDSSSITYIANKNTKKFHYPTCSSVEQMKESNKKYLNCTREQSIQKGYEPCGRCCP